MSLHAIIEPAGALVTGWKLVPKDAKSAADIRNEDECPVCLTDEGDRSLPTPPHAEPAQPPRSRWEVGEVG